MFVVLICIPPYVISFALSDKQSSNFEACKKSDSIWWIVLWFIVKGTTKCSESQQNLVAMVIQMRIYEMFIVMEGQDINFVELPLLLC